MDFTPTDLAGIPEEETDSDVVTMLEDKLKATDWEATNDAIEEEVARESYIQYLKEKEKQLNKEMEGRSLPSASGSTGASTSKSGPRTPKRGGSMSPKGSQSPKAGGSNHPTTPVGSPKGAAGGPPMFLGFDSDHFDDLSPSYSPMSKDSLEGSPKKQQPLDLDYLYQPGTSTSSAKAVNDNVAPCFANFVPTISVGDDDGWNDDIILQVMEESRRTYLEELKSNSKKSNSQGSSSGSSSSS